jgi:hypothetical protein
MVMALMVVSVFMSIEAAEPVKGGYPSKGFWRKTGEVQYARFVFHEEPDLRLLFCDRETLKDRVSRSVCIVDDVRATLAKDERGAAKEIQIDKGIAVADLLKKIGFEKKRGIPWKGGQPQLRVVTRDAIIQSPLQSDTSTGDLDVEAFLNQKLVPGDFLIVATRG